MEKITAQEKIILCLNAISLMSNTLNVVNIEMRQIPSTATDALKYQKDREDFHEGIANKLSEVVEELGDFLNEWDAVDENSISVLNPIMKLISGNDICLEDED